MFYYGSQPKSKKRSLSAFVYNFEAFEGSEGVTRNSKNSLSVFYALCTSFCLELQKCYVKVKERITYVGHSLCIISKLKQMAVRMCESSRELCIYAYFHDLQQETCEFELMRVCVQSRLLHLCRR